MGAPVWGSRETGKSENFRGLDRELARYWVALELGLRNLLLKKSKRKGDVGRGNWRCWG